MTIQEIREGKKRFLPLLLLGDEQEEMIASYLGRGTLFALYDPELTAVAVVTEEGDGICEVKNLAVQPARWRQGYGRRFLAWIEERYRGEVREIQLGTGEDPGHLAFYTACGYQISHRIKDFFLLHYDHPVVEDGVLLRDMVYLKKALFPAEKEEQ